MGGCGTLIPDRAIFQIPREGSKKGLYKKSPLLATSGLLLLPLSNCWLANTTIFRAYSDCPSRAK